MGIKNLTSFLRKHCNNVFQPIHLSELSYKKIAIDTSLFMHKFKSVYQDNWVNAFINLVGCLRKNDIHCVFVYDSKAPPEKDRERKIRQEQRQKNKDDLLSLMNALDLYLTDKIASSLLIDISNKSKAGVQKRYLSTSTDISYEDIDISAIENKIARMKCNIIEVSQSDFNLTKSIFSALSIPWIDAPTEAEKLCSTLCKKGLVDAVLSEDSDVIAYECPLVLSRLDIFNSVCYKIEYSDILGNLGLDSDSFLDFCIMCGCDYNQNIPNIGIETSYVLIQKLGSIHNLKKELEKEQMDISIEKALRRVRMGKKSIDFSILNSDRVRAIFKEEEIIDIDYIPFCGPPNFDELSFLCKENNINIDIETLKRHIIKNIRFENK